MKDELTEHRLKKMIRKIATDYMKSSDSIFDKIKIQPTEVEKWLQSLPEGAHIVKLNGHCLHCTQTNEMYILEDSHDRL